MTIITTMAVSLIKRGSSLCQYCGHSNGNKSLQCKVCRCPLPKRAKTSSQEISTNGTLTFNKNVSSLLIDGVLPAGGEIYSVRVRDQGPDYRYLIFNHY